MTQAQAVPTGRILLRDVRLSFASGIWEATTIPGADATAKPKFNCGLILPPDHPQLADINAKMVAVAKEKWGAKWEAQYKAIEKADKLALHDGDTKAYDGYAGNLFMSPSANEDSPPNIFDSNKRPLTKKDGRPYGGCYVNASIELWAQDNGFGKRINAQLRGIQFLRDGDAFSAGRPADSDEFEDVSEGADAADFA